MIIEWLGVFEWRWRAKLQSRIKIWDVNGRSRRTKLRTRIGFLELGERISRTKLMSRTKVNVDGRRWRGRLKNRINLLLVGEGSSRIKIKIRIKFFSMVEDVGNSRTGWAWESVAANTVSES